MIENKVLKRYAWGGKVNRAKTQIAPPRGYWWVYGSTELRGSSVRPSVDRAPAKLLWLRRN